MNCEEFESIGLGLEHESAAQGLGLAADTAAARAHANHCSRCAALQDSWRAAQAELMALRGATQAAATPVRVEMRLRQEFRTRHHTMKIRRGAVVSAWVLATAALLVGAINWKNWRAEFNSAGRVNAPINLAVSPDANGRVATDAVEMSALEPTLVAANDVNDFTLLPGSLPEETDGASIVRVRLQRGALSSLGLPVNEENASEWIQVDLLVGEDGQPQAVRLPQ
ncbi:MAG TPA: hypothetical protein VGI16_04655 [Candidatus Acidoferrum sp.]|jgi:hypothetical protein